MVSIQLTTGTLGLRPGRRVAESTAQIRPEVTLDGVRLRGQRLHREEGISLGIRDSDWNVHYMQVREYHQSKLTFRLLLNDSGSAIKECWLAEGVSEISGQVSGPQQVTSYR